MRITRERKVTRPCRVHGFVNEIFGDDMHAARVQSLGNAVVGVIQAGVLGIHAIGEAYAQFASISRKAGVKQVDRLLSNGKLCVDAALRVWVNYVVGERTELLLAMDWTEFDGDNHSVLAVYLVTNHGRSTPIAWHTVEKSSLKGNQRRYEYEMIERLHHSLDLSKRVTILADRGFGDQKLYKFLTSLGWDFVIRFRQGIHVTSAAGETRKAGQWLGPSGRAKMLRGASVTAARLQVPAVVVTWDKEMKEPWCLATSLSSESAAQVVKRYGRRFTIEETFRDHKDLHFGMGLKATHIGSAARRDRMLLIAALAHALLTLLGAAAERAGLDRIHKANTVKRRTHSLFRQGVYWYHAIPNTRKEWLVPLLESYDQILRERGDLCEILGVI